MNTDLTELFYQQVGSSWILDALFLFLNTPLGLIGFVLNCLSFYILFKIKQKTKKILYSYLTMYSLFSMSLCILNTLLSILSSPRYFDFIFTEPGSFIKCNLLTWANTSNYFILNIIDCILLLERLTTITNYNFIKSFFNYNPNFVCILIIILANLINLSSFFILSSRSNLEYKEAMNNLETLTNFTYCYRQPFFLNQTGRSLVVVTIAFRDIISLLIELLLSIYSIIYFRRYIKQKSIESNSFQNLNSTSSQNQIDLIKKIEKYNINLTKMTIYLSLCSMISHFGIAIFYIQISNNDKESFLRRYSVFITTFLVNLKFLSNFLLFYQFNVNFRYYFKKNSNYLS